MRNRLASACLVLEAFVVFFAALAALPFSDLPRSTVLGAGSALTLACLLGAALVRRPWGMVVGWALQALVLATGFWVPAMFFLGAVFLAIWLWFLVIGTRIDRERAARATVESRSD